MNRSSSPTAYRLHRPILKCDSWPSCSSCHRVRSEIPKARAASMLVKASFGDDAFGIASRIIDSKSCLVTCSNSTYALGSVCFVTFAPALKFADWPAVVTGKRVVVRPRQCRRRTFATMCHWLWSREQQPLGLFQTPASNVSRL